MYFASTSTSMFTAAPTGICPKVVWARVAGMSPTSTHAEDALGSDTAVRVRDTPLRAIEPLIAVSGASSLGIPMRRVDQSGRSVRSRSSPRPSTCPWTT